MGSTKYLSIPLIGHNSDKSKRWNRTQNRTSKQIVTVRTLEIQKYTAMRNRTRAAINIRCAQQTDSTVTDWHTENGTQCGRRRRCRRAPRRRSQLAAAAAAAQRYPLHTQHALTRYAWLCALSTVHAQRQMLWPITKILLRATSVRSALAKIACDSRVNC